MVDFRLINGRVEIGFEPDEEYKYEAEFNQSRSNIDEWLSHEKVRGESENSDPLTIKLLVELYKKVDELSNIIFARVNLPLFIKREVLIYFKALTPKCAKILKLSRGNEKEWNAFVAESDRLEIRKAKNSEQ